MATAAENLCSELATLGVDVTVITSEATGRFQSDELGQVEQRDEALFRTVRLPVAARAFERFTGMHYTPDFRAVYAKLATTAEIVHFHGFRSYQNFAAARITQKCGKRYLLQPHGTSVRGYGKGLLKIVYDHVKGLKQATNAASLIASTRVEALQLMSMGFSPEKIHTIPIGVHRERWARNPATPTLFRDHLRISRNVPVVLFVGRLDSTKGLDLLIESFGAVLEKTPDAMLVLVGPDFGMQSRLETRVRKSGLGNHVIFAGPASQERVHSAYKESTLVVVPSTYESFSLVALEAAAAGTPTVVTEDCGLAAAFQSVGLSVAKADIASLSSTISRLIQDEDFRALQRGALYKLPWERFSWREVAREVLAVYEDTVRS
jgi:glycosyltransferase involved in cell wall biosynthesis